MTLGKHAKSDLDVKVMLTTQSRYAPHTNATFKQHYYFDASYYKPGGPVFLYIGGETDARNRFSNLKTGIIQILMNATGGLGVIIENRYYGQSVPFENLTTDNLAYLTNEQTIADFAYFAQHASFPGVNATLTAPATPWILYGGSLAGAQTSFTVKTYPDLVYGGIAASGVIRAAVEYPEWYDPIQKFGPSDCVQSINDIVDKFDALVEAGNTEAIQEFKSLFGLESLADNRDFAKTIAYPVGSPFDYPTPTWQELSWINQKTQFWSFCGNVTNIDAPEEVTAVDEQLAKYTDGEPWENLGNYAKYVKEVILPTCESGDYASGECFGQGNGKLGTAFLDPWRPYAVILTQRSDLLDRASRLLHPSISLHNMHRGRPVPNRAKGGQIPPVQGHGRQLHPRTVYTGLPAGRLQHYSRFSGHRQVECVWRARLPGG